jgi:hypothetical protein
MSQSNTVLPTTLPVPIFGKIAYEMGENTSYAAATRGDFPTIKIGGKVRVPVRLALAKIAGGDHEILKAMTADFAAKLDQLMAEQTA